MELHNEVKRMIQDAICGVCQKMLKYSGYLQIKVHMTVISDEKQLLDIDFKETLGDTNCRDTTNLSHKDVSLKEKNGKPHNVETLKSVQVKSSQSSYKTAPNQPRRRSLKTRTDLPKNTGTCQKQKSFSDKKHHSLARLKSSTKPYRSIFRRVLSKCRGCSWKLSRKPKCVPGVANRRPYVNRPGQDSQSSCKVHGSSAHNNKEGGLQNTCVPSTEEVSFKRKSIDIADWGTAEKRVGDSDVNNKLLDKVTNSSEKDIVIRQTVTVDDQKSKDSELLHNGIQNDGRKLLHKDKYRGDKKELSRGEYRTNGTKKERFRYHCPDPRRRFHCRACDKSFTFRTNLTRHMRQFHSRVKAEKVPGELAVTHYREKVEAGFLSPAADHILSGPCDTFSTASFIPANQAKESKTEKNSQKNGLDLFEISPIVIAPHTNGLEPGKLSSSECFSSQKNPTGNGLVNHHGSVSTTNDIIAPCIMESLLSGHTAREPGSSVDTGVDRGIVVPVHQPQDSSVNSQNSSTSQTIDVVNVSNETSSNGDTSSVLPPLEKCKASHTVGAGGVKTSFGCVDNAGITTVLGQASSKASHIVENGAMTTLFEPEENKGLTTLSGVSASKPSHLAETGRILAAFQPGLSKGITTIQGIFSRGGQNEAFSEDARDLKLMNSLEQLEKSLVQGCTDTDGEQKIVEYSDKQSGTSTGQTRPGYPAKGPDLESADALKETKQSLSVTSMDVERVSAEKEESCRKDKEPQTMTKELEAFPVLGLFDMVSPAKNLDSRFVHPLTFSPVRSPLFSLATSPISASTPFFRTSADMERKLEARRLYEDIPSPTFGNKAAPGPLLNIPSYLPQSSSFLASGLEQQSDLSKQQKSHMDSISTPPTKRKRTGAEEFVDISRLTNSAKKVLPEVKVKSNHAKKQLSYDNGNLIEVSAKHQGLDQDYTASSDSSQKAKTRGNSRMDPMQKPPGKSPANLPRDKPTLISGSFEQGRNEVSHSRSSESLLASHGGRTTANKYRFACSLCSAKFTFRTNLTRHLKKQHWVTPADSEGT